MPLGADTPSAMIGGHLASCAATRLGWPTTFVRALVVAGVAAGISSTFLARWRRSCSRSRSSSVASAASCSWSPRSSRWRGGFVTYELVGTPATYPIPLPMPSTGTHPPALPRAGHPRRGRRHRLRHPPQARRNRSGRATSAPDGPDGPRGRVRRARGDLAARGHGHRNGDDEGPVRRRDDAVATLLVLADRRDHPHPVEPGRGLRGGVIGPSMLIGSTLGAAVGTW